MPGTVFQLFQISQSIKVEMDVVLHHYSVSLVGSLDPARSGIERNRHYLRWLLDCLDWVKDIHKR